MEVCHEISQGILIVKVRGRLDVSTSPAFIKQLSELEKLPTVLDMEGLEYLSSAGLRALHVVKKDKPQVVVANFSGFCKEIYEVAGFSAIVAEHSSLEEAVKALTA